MSFNLAKILELLDRILELEEEIEFLVSNISDNCKRRKLKRAVKKALKTGKEKDLKRVRKWLFKV